MSNIAHHYNQQRYRKNDDMLGVRGAHNFVKDALIRRCDVSRVLDVCSGNGGDVQKFYRAGCREYIGIDIAQDAVARANDRIKDMPVELQADTMVMDVNSQTFDSYMKATRKFTCVSCQFAIHYTFDEETNIDHLMACISNALLPGGKFIGTTTDATQLYTRRHALGRRFGDRFFKVVFNDPVSRADFGEAYKFTLKGAVENLEEYVVQKDVLTMVAERHGLTLTLWENLHTFAEQSKATAPGRFDVFRAELRDISKLYCVFEFSKS